MQGRERERRLTGGTDLNIITGILCWRSAFLSSSRLRSLRRQGIYTSLPLSLPQIEASVVQWSACFVVASAIETSEETLVQIQALAGVAHFLALIFPRWVFMTLVSRASQSLMSILGPSSDARFISIGSSSVPLVHRCTE